MNHYQQLIADEILSAQAQKKYCQTKLAEVGLQTWESKEYSALVAQYDETLRQLSNRLPLASQKNAPTSNNHG